MNDDTFFENERPVPAVDFDYPQDPEQAAIVAARKAVASVLEFAKEARTPSSAGRRMWALAFVVGALPSVRTKKQLARKLGCSGAMVSKLTDAARRSLRESNNVAAKVKCGRVST